MRKIIISLLSALVLCSCEQNLPDFPDFDYTAVYFPLQYPIRTLSLGNDEIDNSLDKQLKFHISVNIGGMYSNNKSWTVDFVVDENLAVNVQNNNGDTILALPATYYLLTPVNQVVIPPGSFSGLIEVQLQDTFLDDSLAYGNHYVIPLRITGTSADSILSGEPSEAYSNLDPRVPGEWITPPKNFTLFGIKYINEYHGIYLHRGRDIIFDSGNNPVDTVIYRQPYVERDELWNLSTRGRKIIFTDGIARYRGAIDGLYKMKLTISENGQILVESLPGARYAASGTGSYMIDGDQWGGQLRDVIYLEYEFPDGDKTHHVNDTLVFRNRGVHFEEFNPVVTGSESGGK